MIFLSSGMEKVRLDQVSTAALNATFADLPHLTLEIHHEIDQGLTTCQWHSVVD